MSFCQPDINQSRKGKIVIPRLLLIALASLVSTASASASDSDAEKSFELQFGILFERKPGIHSVKESTTEIPRFHGSTGFLFGYLIREKNAKAFQLTTVTYPPSAPKILGISYKDQDSSRGLRSRPRELNGSGVSMFSFDRGDPTGPWKMEIYVDGKLLRTVRFTVYEPNDKRNADRLAATTEAALSDELAGRAPYVIQANCPCER
jgi:hypothetical protein